MAYGNNDKEQDGAPKKADVLIRSTQHIALRQEEISEQTKLALSRLDEAIELFSKNNQDSSYFMKQSNENLSRLQNENSALKQELLYLAKQSENIYAGLADKITGLSEQAKIGDEATAGLAEQINNLAGQSKLRDEDIADLAVRINAVAENVKKTESAYSDILDRLAYIADQGKRNDSGFATLNHRLEIIYEHTKRNEKAYSELSGRIGSTDRDRPDQIEVDNSQVLDKLNFISEQLRRTESAHSMLADKFEILSMRVDQLGYQSSKVQPGYPQTTVAPVAYPVPAQVVKEEIDYDKLAEKVASLLSTRDAVSPDYIASKVAEQIVIPEVEASKINVSVDSGEIARQVAGLIGAAQPRVGEPIVAMPEIDGDALADKIAAKLGGIKAEVVPAGDVTVNIDQEELADAIAVKVGSLKAEDFDILVDDEGCTSISREIANHLDYNVISDIISEKLRSALDLAAVNAPDYEEMAERISEKITVAGINEDAIANKAAEVLSNYLPELDTDEITDKITGAVIDVVSAIPQPTVNSEEICNTITERLIESQEDHDYDIVIDDDGISRITELVSDEIEKQTATRFDKVEEDLAKLTELVTSVKDVAEDKAAEEEVEDTEEADEAAVTVDEEVRTAEIREEDYSMLCGLMAEEIEKGTASRFDKVEDDIAKLRELVSSVVTDEDYEYEEAAGDYTAISDVVAAEIQKGVTEVTARLDGVEENLAKLNDYITADDADYETAEGEEEEAEEVEEVEEAEDDLATLSEIVATEIQKGVSARLDSMDENLAKIVGFFTEEEGEESDEEYAEGEDEEDNEISEDTEEAEDSDEYIALTEIQKGVSEVSARLDGMEENLAKIAEFFIDDENEDTQENTNADETVETEGIEETADGEETEEAKEEEADYTAISEIVASEIQKGVSGVYTRLDGVEESLAKLNGYFVEEDEEEGEYAFGETDEYDDYAAISEIVATEIQKGISARLEGVEENLAQLNRRLSEEDTHIRADESVDAESVSYPELPSLVTVQIQKDLAERFDSVDESLANLTQTTLAISSKLLYNELSDGEKEEQAFDEFKDYTALSNVLATEIERGISYRIDSVEDNLVKLAEKVNNGGNDERLDKIEQNIAKLTEYVEGNAAAGGESEFESVRGDVAQIKQMLESGIPVTGAVQVETVAAAESAAILPAEEEEELVTVSGLIKPEEGEKDDEEFEEEEEETEEAKDDGDDDFLMNVFDMDAFSDDEPMPGDFSDFGGVDFANMMKYKRSFIARIIQSNDDTKQYYGEVKHALLSYKKVNSNVAWSSERFNKGRETIARLKIRGKTLCLYLALDPLEYKTSVYHHIDVSDNKSVNGTPMMVKIKSNLGVRKAIRLIGEMLAMRNGEKREVPERNYAAMYPYETIEELIEDGLVKDVRKK